MCHKFDPPEKAKPNSGQNIFLSSRYHDGHLAPRLASVLHGICRAFNETAALRSDQNPFLYQNRHSLPSIKEIFSLLERVDSLSER